MKRVSVQKYPKVFGVFAVKYTYFKPQNILTEAKNILMISYLYL